MTEFLDSLSRFRSNIRDVNDYAMMNYTCGFDTPRLLTSLFNKNKYKYYCKVHERPDYKIHKPDEATYQILQLLLVQQYTYVGSPHIYAGDEMGMWGADDPSSRKPLIWKDYDFDDEVAHPLGQKRPVDKVAFDDDLFSFYQKVIRLRKENPVLVHGKIEPLLKDDEKQLLAYSRYDESEEIIAVFNTSNEQQRIELPTRNEDSMINFMDGKTVERVGKTIQVTIPAGSAAVLVSASNN